MKVPFIAGAEATLVPSQATFALYCEVCALLYVKDAPTLQEATDALQDYAERSGLVAVIGQDATQSIMSDAFACLHPGECEWCGLRLEQHMRIDTAAGPEFFCDDLEALIQLRAADLVIHWEMEDSRACETRQQEQPSRPAPNTIAAFQSIVERGNVGALKAWLADRPQDAPFLLALLESPVS
jgi:hypothetical protein